MRKSDSKYFHTAVKFDEALLALLEKKPFAYITVSEICKEAGVNRSTFYLHYENTMDLLNETTRHVLDGFAAYFTVDAKSITEKFENCDLKELVFINERYLRPYLTYVQDHKRLFMAVMSQPSVFQFDMVFHRLFDRILDPILDRFDYPEWERKYVMKYYLNGITAVLIEWIRDDCTKSAAEIAAIIYHCIFGAWNPAEIEKIMPQEKI